MIQTEKYTFPTPNRVFFYTFPMQNWVIFYTFPISLPHPHENQRWGGPYYDSPTTTSVKTQRQHGREPQGRRVARKDGYGK